MILKCSYCDAVIREISDDYIREFPIASQEWIEKLLEEHSQECWPDTPENQIYFSGICYETPEGLFTRSDLLNEGDNFHRDY